MKTLVRRQSCGPAVASILWLFGITQALRDPGSPQTVLFQNPTSLQVDMENGAPDRSRGSGTLTLLS